MGKLMMILCFACILFTDPAYCEEQSSDNGGVGIPPGMEMIKEGDVNVVVPKGGRLRKQDSVMLIETADEYASRKFEDADGRFEKIEKELEACKKEIGDLKSAIKKLRRKCVEKATGISEAPRNKPEPSPE